MRDVDPVCASRRHSERAPRRIVAALSCLAALTVGAVASADDSTWNRHPLYATPASKPAGVPADYVITRNGFFHPSCVVTLRSDEKWGRDLVIRGLDGVAHDQITPCAYPRYSLGGRPIPTDGSQSGRAPTRSTSEKGVRHGPSHDPTYDGWVVFYDYAGAVATGSSLSTEWTVPLPPTTIGDQDLAFFNDIETKDVILQPVLDFSEIPGKWAIESENCCVQNNDVQSTLVQVSPGDVILGVVTMADCNSSDDCTDWTVTTTDLTTGKSTALTMQNPGAGESANEIDSAVLETYGVTACDMFPANGEATFYDNDLTNGQGAAEPVTYDLETILPPSQPPAPAGFPTNCGYSGTSSGNSYTLIFGTSPTPVGANDGGISIDASVPDSGGSSDGGEGADATTTGEDASSGNHRDSGAVVADSGVTETEDASSDDSDALSPQPAGCGCTTAGSPRGSGAMALGLGLLLTLRARRRRNAPRPST